MKKLVLLLVLGILLFGCTQYGGGSPGTPPGGGTGTTKTVHIQNFAFNPADITVKKGDTVTWVNDDGATHQIKSAIFPSAPLPNGATFQHTFNEAPGVYRYSCAIHPSMVGSVTVTG